MKFRPLVLVALVGFGPAVTAHAQSRPYSYREFGQFVNANDFVSEGEATHLGHFHAMGSVQFTPTNDPAVLEIAVWAVVTAANGDELHELVTGQLNLQTGGGTTTVFYIGGTGRDRKSTRLNSSH